MMQTPVEGELFVTVVEEVLPSEGGGAVLAPTSTFGAHLRPFSYVAERIPLFNLTEPLFVTSLLH